MYVKISVRRYLGINKTYQVWAINISSVPMKNGFKYLTAIRKNYSHFFVGGQACNSLEKGTRTTLLQGVVSCNGFS
jgi:hypothetical protein